VALLRGRWHIWGQRSDIARGQVVRSGTERRHCEVAHGDGEVAHLGTERRCCRRAGGTSGDGEVTLLGDRWHCPGTGRRHTWRRKGGAARGQAAHGEQGGGPARAQAAPGPRGGDRARR